MIILPLISDLLTNYWVNTVIVSGVAVSGAILAYSIYKQGKHVAANRVVAIFFSAMVFWVVSAHLGDSDALKNYSLAFNRLAYVALSFMFYSIFMLPFVFPTDTNIIKPVFKRFWLLLAIIISIISICTDKFISNVQIFSWGASNIDGSWYPLFAIYGLASIIPFFRYIKIFKEADNLQRKQLKIFLTGFFLFIVSMLFVYIGVKSIVKTDQYYRFGNYSVIYIISFMAYAIIKQKLFNIKVFFSEIWSILLLVSILIWVDLHFSYSNLFGVLVIISICTLFIRSVISEAEKNKKLEKAYYQLERDKKQLLKVDQMKDEFLMMATHELTTPITAIRGKLSMAIQENMAHLDTEQKKYFEPILEATNRLNHLSGQLLNVSRIDQNSLIIYPQDVLIDDLIEEILTEYRVIAENKGNSLNYISKNKKICAYIDRKKVKEVISNLVDNSIHFTSKGKITIQTELNKTKDECVISVTDTGSGIDEKEQKNLFGKFNQTNRFNPMEMQEQQGAGLGLYISKKYIMLHGGKIWLKSEKNKGSSFFFSIPLKKVAN